MIRLDMLEKLRGVARAGQCGTAPPETAEPILVIYPRHRVSAAHRTFEIAGSLPHGGPT